MPYGSATPLPRPHPPQVCRPLLPLCSRCQKATADNMCPVRRLSVNPHQHCCSQQQSHVLVLACARNLYGLKCHCTHMAIYETCTYNQCSLNNEFNVSIYAFMCVCMYVYVLKLRQLLQFCLHFVCIMYTYNYVLY